MLSWVCNSCVPQITREWFEHFYRDGTMVSMRPDNLDTHQNSCLLGTSTQNFNSTHFKSHHYCTLKNACLFSLGTHTFCDNLMFSYTYQNRVHQILTKGAFWVRVLVHWIGQIVDPPANDDPSKLCECWISRVKKRANIRQQESNTSRFPLFSLQTDHIKHPKPN